MPEKYKRLIEAAVEAKEFAFAPFSKFRVGAAIETTDGEIFKGCNIENSSYGLTICAERTAIFKAYSEGRTKFVAIAVASDGDDFTPPCGACRQVIYDLAGDIDFILINPKKQIKKTKAKTLLPLAFNSNYLNRIPQSRNTKNGHLRTSQRSKKRRMD